MSIGQVPPEQPVLDPRLVAVAVLVALVALAAPAVFLLSASAGRDDVRVVVSGVPLLIPTAYIRYPGQRADGPAAGVTLHMALPDMAEGGAVVERLLRTAGLRSVVGVTVSDPDLGGDAEASYRTLAEAGYWPPDALDRTREGWQRLAGPWRSPGGQAVHAYVSAGRIAMLAFCDEPASGPDPECHVRTSMTELPLLVSFSVRASLFDELPGVRRKVFSRIVGFVRRADQRAWRGGGEGGPRPGQQ